MKGIWLFTETSSGAKAAFETKRECKEFAVKMYEYFILGLDEECDPDGDFMIEYVPFKPKAAVEIMEDM